MLQTSMQPRKKLARQVFPKGVKAQMVWHMAAESEPQPSRHFALQFVSGLGQASPAPPPRAGYADGDPTQDCTSSMATHTTAATILSAEAPAAIDRPCRAS